MTTMNSQNSRSDLVCNSVRPSSKNVIDPSINGENIGKDIPNSMSQVNASRRNKRRNKQSKKTRNAPQEPKKKPCSSPEVLSARSPAGASDDVRSSDCFEQLGNSLSRSPGSSGLEENNTVESGGDEALALLLNAALVPEAGRKKHRRKKMKQTRQAVAPAHSDEVGPPQLSSPVTPQGPVKSASILAQQSGLQFNSMCGILSGSADSEFFPSSLAGSMTRSLTELGKETQHMLSTTFSHPWSSGAFRPHFQDGASSMPSTEAFRKKLVAESEKKKALQFQRDLEAAVKVAEESLNLRAQQLVTSVRSDELVSKSDTPNRSCTVDLTVDLCLQHSAEQTGVSARSVITLPMDMEFGAFFQLISELTNIPVGGFKLRPVLVHSGVPSFLHLPAESEGEALGSVLERLNLQAVTWVQMMNFPSLDTPTQWFEAFLVTPSNGPQCVFERLYPYLDNGFTGFGYRVITSALRSVSPDKHSQWVQSYVETSTADKVRACTAAILQCLCVDGYLQVADVLSALARVRSKIVQAGSTATLAKLDQFFSACNLGEGSVLVIKEEELKSLAPSSPLKTQSAPFGNSLIDHKRRAERKMLASQKRDQEYEAISAIASTKGGKNIFELSSGLKSRIGSEPDNVPVAASALPVIQPSDNLISTPAPEAAVANLPTGQPLRSIISELLRPGTCTLPPTTLRLLRNILSKLIEHHSPGAPTLSSGKDYRKIDASKPKVQEHVIAVPDALRVLEAVGFVMQELPRSAPDSPRESESKPSDASVSDNPPATAQSCTYLIFATNGSFERANLALEKVNQLTH